MAIRFRCDSCGKLLSAKDQDSGRKATCPACKQPSIIPDKSEEAGPPQVPPQEEPVARCEIVCRCGRVLMLTPAQLEHGVICANCGRRVPEGEEPETPRPDEMTELPWGLGPTLRDAFIYPARGTGLISISIVVVVIFVANLIFSVGSLCPLLVCVLIIIPILAAGFAVSYLLSAIAGSARMELRPPDLPDYKEIVNDLLYPFVLFAVPALFSYLPAVVYASLTAARAVPAVEAPAGNYMIPVGFLVLVALGSFVFPMTLMRVAGLYSLAGLNPVVIFRTILRVPLQYLGLVLVLLLAIGMGFVARTALTMTPFVGICVGTLVGPFISFYMMVATMRLMGMFVAKYQDRLGWTDLESLPSAD